MKMKFNLTISSIIATGFGVGKIPYAPGTFGSLLAFPLYAFMTYIVSRSKGGVDSIAAFELSNYLMLLTFLLFLIGVWASECYCSDTQQSDPKEIVIDEIVGQLLTIGLVIGLLPYIGGEAIEKFKSYGIDELKLALYNLAASFILFRVFDILKPWPIDLIDQKVKGGLGVMLDDVLAAIFAVVMQFFILYALAENI
jgi:phosphatidylglycerophosphatase A